MDFPLMLFSQCEENDTKVKNAAVINKSVDDLFHLDYNVQLDAVYDDATDTVECITQKYRANFFIRKLSPCLPWQLPKKSELGIDPYLNIKFDRDDYFEYFDVSCKETVAKFYKNRFTNGTTSKCCYLPKYSVWLTPVEFQHISGSTQAEWKSMLSLKSGESKKTKDTKTVKTLLEMKMLNMHSMKCNCAMCLDYDYMQYENFNYLDSILMNDENIIHIHPNYTQLNMLDVDISKLNDLKSRNILNSSGDVCNIRLKLKEETQSNRDLIIKQICTQFTDNNDNDFMVNLKLNDSYLKTVNFELIESESNLKLKRKTTFERYFNDSYISSIAASPHIRGEFLVCLGRSGIDSNSDVYLQTSHLNSDVDLVKVASNLNANFQSKSHWNNVAFSSHPRNFIYADYSKIVSIDARIRNATKKTEIFNIQNSSRNVLNLNEIIERNLVIEPEHLNTHLICCTNTMLCVDERFTKIPLITWKHHLNRQPPAYLKSVYFNSGLNVIICSDLVDTIIYEYNSKEKNMPILYNFPLKVDFNNDFQTSLPLNYDKRLKRHMKYRFNKLNMGLSAISYQPKNFMLFQMKSNTDMYYQCFQVNNKEKENSTEPKSEQLENYNYWLDSVKKFTLNPNDTLLERNIETSSIESYDDILDNCLPPSSKYCKICNVHPISLRDTEEMMENDDIDRNMCERCGNEIDFTERISSKDVKSHFISKSNTDTNFLTIDKKFIPNDDENQNKNNELTKSLYELWKNDYEEFLSKTNDLNISEENMDETENTDKHKTKKTKRIKL